MVTESRVVTEQGGNRVTGWLQGGYREWLTESGNRVVTESGNRVVTESGNREW